MLLNIIKIGGPVLETPELLQGVLNDFVQLEGLKILVHGGGKEATRLAEKLEIPVEMIAGRRKTNTATLELITMLYAGKINKQLVAQLQQLKCNALGVSGADANLITARKRPTTPVDYGWVGDIEKINSAALKNLLTLLEATPVFCALTHDAKGQLLNTNADSIAAALAIAMQPHFEVHLYFCSDTHGVYGDIKDSSSLLQQLNYKQYQELIQSGVIQAGMLPKLDNAFAALQKGVNKVTIGGPSCLQTSALKTQLF
jgi:acetylglutamate kinase